MQNTKEFVERITPRLSNVRKERLDFIWNDFLGAVEKVINKLTDEQLAATSWISIYYETKENDKSVYRSKVAEVDYLDDKIVYEQNDICLGTKCMLERTFRDFIEQAKQDEYCDAGWFYLDDLFQLHDTSEQVRLDFDISRVKIEFNNTSETMHKIISE